MGTDLKSKELDRVIYKGRLRHLVTGCRWHGVSRAQY